MTRNIATSPSPDVGCNQFEHLKFETSVEILGQIQNRQILYTNILTDQTWFEKLPTDNWVVFTIGDEKKAEFEAKLVSHCLDKNVCYACSAGQLAGSTELEFDLEIVNRAIATEDSTGKEHDYEQSPCTTSHKNFSEGFWFAATLAHDPYKDLGKVVCTDFTTKGVKNNLKELIEKINNGWLPTEEEVEEPKYDR